MATARIPDPEPTAVAELRGLLDELPDPLPEAWAAVSIDDLLNTVQRLNWQQLERLMSVLHAVSPPSPERPACAVILELAGQPALQERITRVVTAPVRRALHEVYAGERPRERLLAEWPPPVVRLALLSDLSPGRDAAGLTGAAVLELLESGLAPSGWAGRHEELAARARATRETARGRLELAYATDADSGEPGPSTPGEERAGRFGPQPAIDRAAAALEQARAAWTRTGAALDAGSGPADEDLDAIEAVGAALRDAAAALRAALGGIGFEQEVEPTLPGLHAARDRWDALRRPEARAAHRLLRVDGPADVAEPLELLREVARGVVERAGRWDDEDRALAGFFHDLAALIEGGASRSTPIGRLLELYESATRSSPADDFAPVFLLAVRGALTLPPEEATRPTPAAAGPDLPDSPDVDDSPEAPESPDIPEEPTGDNPDDPGDSPVPPPPPTGSGHGTAHAEGSSGVTGATASTSAPAAAPSTEGSPGPGDDDPDRPGGGAPRPAVESSTGRSGGLPGVAVARPATPATPGGAVPGAGAGPDVPGAPDDPGDPIDPGDPDFADEPTEDNPDDPGAEPLPPPPPPVYHHPTDRDAAGSTSGQPRSEAEAALPFSPAQNLPPPDRPTGQAPTPEQPEHPPRSEPGGDQPTTLSDPLNSQDAAAGEPQVAAAAGVGDPAAARADEHADADAELPGRLGALLATREFGLAYWLAVAAKQPEQLTRFLRICAQVDALRDPAGPGAEELRLLLRDTPPQALLGAGALRPLALTVAARACLTAPFSGVATRLSELLEDAQDLPGLAATTRAAADTGSRGIPLPDLGASPRHLAACEAELQALGEQARQLLAGDHDLGDERGARIWRHWTEPAGLLGGLLGPMTSGDLTEPAATATRLLAAADRFTEHGTARRVLRQHDRQLRGDGPPIAGPARRALLGLAEEAVTLARRWAQAALRLQCCRAAATPDRAPDWVKAPLERLRAAVAGNDAAARTELERWQARPDPLAAGAARAAAALHEETATLATTGRLGGSERPPARALGAGLLRSSVPLTTDLLPRNPATLSVEAVAEATGRSWEEAFNARMGAGQYGTAAAVLEELRAAEREAPTAREDPAADERRSGELQAELDTARGYAATLVREHAAELLTDIRRARRRGGLTADGAAGLAGRLEATLERTEPNLDVVSEELDRIVADLEEQQREAAARIRRNLAELRGPSALTDGLSARVDTLVEQGDLTAAEEQLAAARAGGELPPPTAEPPGFGDFFPAVPDALPDGINQHLLAAARDRAVVGPLDFGRLTEEELTAAVDAFSGWLEVDRGPWHERQLQTLVPALRLCGIEASSGEWLALPRSTQRRWADLLEVRTSGTAPVAQFGSGRQNRMRLLLCWRHPAASTLLDWLAQDPSGAPTVVLYFGTISPRERLELAAECRRRPARPVVVVDDAVLAFAAVVGRGRFDAVLRATLPFAALNPFTPDAGGDTPPEVFTGRQAELSQVTDPDGAALLFGGHQIGTTSLLHAAARHVTRQPGHVAAHARVADARGGGRSLPEAPHLLWEVVWRALAAAAINDQVTGDHPAGRGDGGREDPAGRVGEAVAAWLDGDPSRRLLLLLDECDAFLEGDAAAGYPNLQQLAALRDRGGGRLKVVLAGRHTALRLAHAPNQPLARLGRPVALGPLAPRDAYELLTSPLRAVGLELTEDLADQILAACDDQPAALQAVGHALVERVLAAGGPDSLPQQVDAGLVRAAAGDGRLHQRVRQGLLQTLDLDGRYRVIAAVAAAAAHAGGADTALTAHELRERCHDWWEAGFAGLAPDAFRALLEELVGLGVLAVASCGRYRLRSAATLRLLGGPTEVRDVLLRADAMPPEDGSLAVTDRRVVLDDRGARSPLTEQQLADVIGQHRNQVRVVLGSPATGVGRVVPALEAAARSAGFALVTSPDQSYLEHVPQAADRGHWVVVSLLSGDEERQGMSVAGCTAWLEKARTTAGGPEATRSVVLVTDERNLDWWLQLFTPGLKLEGAVELVELRRYDQRSLAAWSLDGGHGFDDPAARAELLQVTGGWPVLVDRAAELAGQGATAHVALETLGAELTGVDGALRLVRASGVGSPPVAPLWDRLVTLGGQGRAPTDELVDALSDTPATRLATLASLKVLRALQALVREPDGTLSPEPVLAAAWRRVKA